MKKTCSMVCFVASLLLGCQQAESVNEAEVLKMSIEAGIGNSSNVSSGRYVGDTPNDAAFSANDSIGLSVNEGSFVKWTYNGSQWTPKGNPVYWKDKTSGHEFHAFYPYASADGMSLANVPMPSLLNQNGSMADVAKCDFLVASKEQTYGADGKVIFTEAENAPFEHVSSLVQIKIKGDGDLKSATIDSISIVGANIVTSSTYSFSDGTVTLDEDNASSKLLAKDLDRQMNAADQTFYFLLNAGTVEVSEMSLCIGYTSGNKKYKAKLQGMGTSGKLDSGKLNSYTLNISDGVLSISGHDIKDWDTGVTMDDIVISGEEQS